jgi:hypothetical protein
VVGKGGDGKVKSDLIVKERGDIKCCKSRRKKAMVGEFGRGRCFRRECDKTMKIRS